ncbi:putative bifunctional diguanylate cyclase/phosphodiesterase [Nitratiruptor tergarcus]|uniref:PAS domain S-box-containing protein/diguanylate cyclase (GGDEF) domain-containing protein n=1 Tax=Nitratiruptor tergarcus DSM 16512 TaxID=1069081 RepID=A0A1W1WRG8_9BACT|nr:EAL domain-containing protein [Nitratiruptor tergarcus]SMC08846.1 PAS domain S-box-containing protein/diguanylate cyclase (GGDEF) domain-containing protein [Nitratiruptor tergarcus DSM 16512]
MFWKEDISKQQLDNLFERAKISLLSLIILAFALTYPIYFHEQNSTVFVWLGYILLVACARVYLNYRYSKEKNPDIRLYFNLFFALALLHAIGFSFAAFFISSQNLHDLIFYIFIIAGISAGAISSLLFSKRILIFYEIVLIVPVAIRLLFLGQDFYIMMGVILFLYLGFILHLSLQTYKMFVDLVQLQKGYEQKQKDLSVQSQRFFYLFNNIPIGLFFYDRRLKLTYCNDFFAKILQVSKEKLIGLDMNQLRDKRILPALKKPFMKQNGNYRGRYHSTLSSKEYFIELYTTYIEVGGEIIEGLGVVIDLTELKDYQERIEHLAYYDELTGLAKRSVLFESIDLAIKKVKRYKIYSVLIYMDIDDFKEINDSLGHNIGDLFLQKIAKRISRVIRDVDIAARMGGDEFAILLFEVSQDKNRALIEGMKVANRLAEAISKPVVIEDHTIQTSVSIGIALIDESSQDAFEMIKFADSAMYKIKRTHKNSIQIFDEAMKKQIDNLYTMKEDLEYALQNHEFILHIQPQFDHNKSIVGAEALLRWQHPQKGLLYPGDFFPVVEEFGMMTQLTEEVLYLAKQLIQKLPKKVRIAVNISGRDIYSEQFETFLSSYFDKELICWLDLEITEQVLIQDVNKAIDLITRIKKELAVAVSIDDFGTGYSSLQYLKRLPVDFLKIDRSFVQDLFKDKNDYVIVATIVNMAKSLGLKTIAEGVETKEQFEELQKIGVDFFQGYYLAKPMPEDSFIELLQTSGSVVH